MYTSDLLSITQVLIIQNNWCYTKEISHMLLNEVYDISPSLNPHHAKCTGSDHDRYKSSQLQLIHENMAIPIYTPLSYAMTITSSLYNLKFEMQDTIQ